MALEYSVRNAARICLWIGGCSGVIAIGLYAILFFSEIGAHDEAFGYVFLPMVLAILVSFASFVVGAIISFLLGLNVALLKRKLSKKILKSIEHENEPPAI